MSFVNFLALAIVGYVVVDKVLSPVVPTKGRLPSYLDQFLEDGEGHDLKKAREELNDIRFARLEREIKRIDDDFSDIMSAWQGDF